METQVILRAEHMYKFFGVTKAVVDFSMELKRGEIHGLIGENGSGKSKVDTHFILEDFFAKIKYYFGD